MKRYPHEFLKKLYSVMLEIRLFEEKIISLYPDRQIRTPVHLCVGQEAIAAGVCLWLKKRDVLFSTHRCHGHCIAKGMDLNSMMAELYGRKTGCCGGKGGSMHLSDPAYGIYSTTAIVGGGIPLAVGAALSLKFQKRRDIAVVFFGDGAADEGVFYESLNFAALKKLPVFFVCENNFYATNSSQKVRQPLDNIFKKGGVFGIPGFRCDGNDVLEVSRHAGRCIDRIRAGEGPALLECRTYRWKGHVGPDCDAQKGCRPAGEVSRWIKRCPVKKFESFLRKRGVGGDEMRRIRARLSARIEKAVVFAKNSPWPQARELLTDVTGGGI
ncbi:MAG: thiamine pyrophosphate-dependent dehydrogenase E1 component subunit alpha [Candidatus Omnitrophota bacterium]